ncbi:MAG: amidohydrolase family protein [Chloroflexota bacterium]
MYDHQAESQVAAQVDRSVPFIETHHHLWELDRFPYGWLQDPGTEVHNRTLGDYKAIRTDWGIERLLKEFYGSNVVKSVHVEGDSGAPDPVEETAWLQGIADRYGFPHGIVVYCDLERDGAEQQLERHLAHSNVRGVRIRAHPDDPDTAVFRAAYAALARHGLSYELNASPGKLLSWAEVARRFPDVQVILGHAGFPMERTPEYLEWWRSEINALAEAENVACKISGLGMVDHDWTIDSIRPWVLHCIDAFGVNRAMFGTNWPVDVLYSSYLRQIDAYRVIVAEAGFSREEQEKLLYRNAEKFYRI